MSAGTWSTWSGRRENRRNSAPLPRSWADRPFEGVSAMNLAANLLRTAERYPDRAAVRLDSTVLTYAGLADASARMVTLLRHLGVQSGDRVAVMLPNVPEFAVVYYGVLRAGAVVVPMNPLLREREVGYYAEDSGARLIVAWHDCADEA